MSVHIRISCQCSQLQEHTHFTHVMFFLFIAPNYGNNITMLLRINDIYRKTIAIQPRVDNAMPSKCPRLHMASINFMRHLRFVELRNKCELLFSLVTKRYENRQ